MNKQTEKNISLTRFVLVALTEQIGKNCFITLTHYFIIRKTHIFVSQTSKVGWRAMKLVI